jgi:acyl-CoA synthetase (NDP forming)
VPSYSSLANPVDLTAQVTGDHERVNRVTERVLADPNVDQLIIRYGGVQGAKGEAWASGLAALVERADKPVLATWGRVPDRSEASMGILEQHGIPWLLTPTRTANAAAALYRFARKRAAIAARPPQPTRTVGRRQLEVPAISGQALSEHQSKQLIAVYGIPSTREVLLAPDALASLKRAPLRYPLAVKIDSPDLPHKTEAGAVRLAVRNLAGLKQAAEETLAATRKIRPDAHINGILVSEMAQGVEVIVGAINDRYFGPVVMFGLGGVFTELLRDVSYRFAPFDVATAHG